MKKLGIASIAVAGLLLMSAVPALADNSPNVDTIKVWASLDAQNNVVINGSFTVDNGMQGPVKLDLLGNKSGWHDTGLMTTVNLVKGQTLYQFSFDTKFDVHHYKDYRVVSDDGKKSRTIDIDEGGFRVPEAPSSSMLLLGALPVLGIVAARLTGARIPRPSWRRVA